MSPSPRMRPKMPFALRNLAAALGGAIVLALSVSGAVAASPSFDATPGKLPKTVIPVHYAIELTPDLQSLALAGVEIVDIELREPAAQFVVNAIDTRFGDVTIDDGAQ